MELTLLTFPCFLHFPPPLAEGGGLNVPINIINIINISLVLSLFFGNAINIINISLVLCFFCPPPPLQGGGWGPNVSQKH